MRGQVYAAGLAVVGMIVLAVAGGFDSPAWGVPMTTVAASGHPVVSGAPADTGLVFRRMWSGEEPDFYASTPSQDGRYVTEIDWEKGELVLLDLLTGEFEYVSHVGPWDKDWSFPESSVLSPDGQEVAATWYQKGPEKYQIRIFKRDGSGSRVLLPPSDDHAYSFLEDWSADGTRILATLFGERAKSPQARLVIIEVATGKVAVLKSVKPNLVPLLATFSPDGRFVAYDLLALNSGRTNRDIFVMRSDGTGETAVVGGPANDRLMGWSPDGSSLLFYSDRDLTQGIWQLPLRDGRPDGEPKLLRGDVWGLYPLGFSRSAYFYGVHTEMAQVHTVAVDIEHARQITPVTRVTEPTAGETSGGIWSPDGSQFAYVEVRPGDMFPRLVVRSVTGDDAREFTLEYDSGLPPLPAPAYWSADGRSILFWGTSLEDGSRGYFRIDLRTGTASAVATATSGPAMRNPRQIAWNENWTTYYQARGVNEGQAPRIEAVEVKTGRTRVVTTAEPGARFGPVDLSPDGRLLAVAMRIPSPSDPESGSEVLSVVSTEGGNLRSIVTERIGGIRRQAGIRWSPDGKYLLYVRQADGDTENELVRVPTDGGDPAVIMKGRVRRDLNISADGRWLSFKSGGWKGEIWMIEGLPGTESVAALRSRE